MRVVEVNSIDGLPGLRLAWTSLLRETPGAGFHQSCQWLEAVCRQAEPATWQLRVLLVTGGGETVGILPLVQTERATPAGTLRVVGYPRDPWSPCQGPIGPHPTATLMAGLRHLSSSQQPWDMLDFRDVDRASPNYARTRSALQVAAMRFHETDEVPCQVIDLSMPSRQRDTDHAAVRRDWFAAGQPTFQRYRPRGVMHDDANPHWDIFNQCLELRCDQQQHSRPTNELLRDIHAAASRAGAADMNIYRLGNQIVACCYNVHLGGTLLTLFGGDVADRQAADDADPMQTPMLVSKMWQDSVTRGDRHWFPGTKRSYAAWPSRPQHRSRFIHHRRGGTRHLIGRLGAWLPLPS